MKSANHWKQWPTEKLSSRVLYALIAVAAVVFLLFWLVGFDRPFDDDPNFNAPLFTNVLLGFIYLLMFIALSISVWGMWRALKIRGRGEKTVNNVPVKKIGYMVLLGTIALLLLTFLLASTEPIRVNGGLYANIFWLRTTDMLVNTSLLMILVAAGAVVYGTTRYNRKASKFLKEK